MMTEKEKKKKTKHKTNTSIKMRRTKYVCEKPPIDIFPWILEAFTFVIVIEKENHTKHIHIYLHENFSDFQLNCFSSQAQEFEQNSNSNSNSTSHPFFHILGFECVRMYVGVCVAWAVLAWARTITESMEKYTRYNRYIDVSHYVA